MVELLKEKISIMPHFLAKLFIYLTMNRLTLLLKKLGMYPPEQNEIPTLKILTKARDQSDIKGYREVRKKIFQDKRFQQFINSPNPNQRFQKGTFLFMKPNMKRKLKKPFRI